MSVEINQAESSEQSIPVRRRNPQGEYENVSLSLPKELTDKINFIVATTKQSRSLVISTLLTEAFNAREGK